MFRIAKYAVLAALATSFTLGSTGCDGPKAKSGLTIAEPDAAVVIGVILPARGFAEIPVWEDVARMQEARTRAVAQIYKMNPSDPPSKQAELVRQAAAEGCSVLIVLAIDPAGIAPVIAEVRKGNPPIPVVVLENPIPNVEGLPPAPFVTFQDEVATAKKVVEAAIANAKEAGFDSSGPAMIISYDNPDIHAKIRMNAIREALKAAGVRILPEVKFTGFKDDASKALKINLEIFPKVAMVFADDDNAVRGAAEVRNLSDIKTRRFVLAGYAVDPGLIELSRYNMTAAIVDRKVGEPMKVAFDTALALARGETVAAEIRTPTPLFVRTGAEIEGFFPPYAGRPEMLLGAQKADPAEVSKGGQGGSKLLEEKD